MKAIKPAIAVFIAILTAAPSVLLAQTPLGTAFTYQGQLKEAGIPTDGEYNFIFRLFDAGIGGAQVGGDVQVDEWPVSDGLFTVQLDFGAGVFSGDALWLEVSVRISGGGGEFTTLSPRQPMAPAPYALYALSGPGSGGHWAANGDDIYNTNTGDVGIGITTPSSPLHVVGSGSRTARVRNTSATGGTALVAEATGGSGYSCALNAYVSTPTGDAVYAFNEAESGNAHAFSGETSSPDGVAIYGLAADGSEYSTGIGVYGKSNGDYNAAGVYGEAATTAGTGHGVRGVAATGTGVRGDHQGTGNYGTLGTSTAGVYGRTSHDSLYAVNGHAGSANGYASYFTGGRNYFEGDVGIGTTSPDYPLHVVSADADAVFGESSVSGGVGVHGKASSFEGGGFGVRGDSYGTTGFGVFGIAAMTTGANCGVYGQSQSQTGRGVYGLANNAAGVNYGVYGVSNSPDGWAGYFQGRGYFSGDVGIGTQSPAEALDVVGTVKTTGFQLSTSPADGCVLTSDAAGVGSWQEPTDSPWTTSGADIYFNGGTVGIGTYTPDFGLLDVAGVVGLDILNSGAGGIGTLGANGNLNAQCTHLTDHPNNGFVSAQNFIGLTRAAMYINTSGQGEIYADVKNFRVPNPNQRGTDIWYACVEGPEAAAYIRGTAHLANGRATVSFPDHFTAVATSQGMTVQITPHSAESKGLAVVERSIEGFVVRELFSGAGTYDFDYTVMAVRQGHEDYRVIRPDTEGLPADEIEAGEPSDVDRIADTETR